MMNKRPIEQPPTAKVIPITFASGWKHGFHSYDDLIIDKRVPTWLLPLLDKLKHLKNFLVNNTQKRLFFFCLLASLASCKKESLDNVENIPGLGGDTWAATPIDTWINDSLTVPFNIAVKYKWDQYELSLNKTLVPPKEDKIIPVLSAVKKVWIDTYIAETDSMFMKKYVPKFFALAGSASWNTDGTITLGTAEGGRKVVLYVLNNFRTKGMTGYVPSDSFNIKQMFHTIEHEFGHILHQTVMYPQDFKTISVGFYTSNWNNVSDATAHKDGFVTAYAESAPDEDFVEMIGVMLTEGRAGFEAIIKSIPAGTSDNNTTQAQAIARLRMKESIVVSYFKDTWGIDFYSLQTRVRTQVDKLIR
ncbi:zinc-binding metallopeptidase [Niastella vici]|uniref:zinc-binding metallopeptidase n=1 Tax=Niastella vici TaxID=1703345 RepID=UPI001FE8870E|nr:putative zinc-binding metallopeptidase [Niastella vici]